MAKRITLRDIGQATGYHHTTVSLALRHDPQIPQGTRDAIHAAAEKLGYKPDPMLTALSAYRLAARPVSDHGVLAWLSNTDKPTWTIPNFNFITYLEGAQKRAGEFGYRLEEFLLQAPGMTPERMGQVLQARGIRGVLVAPQPNGSPHARIEMDWAPFAAVAFGYTLEWPPLDLVTDHHMESMKIALRELRLLGYRRIGLYISEEIDTRTNGAFVASFVREMMRLPHSLQIVPLLYKTWEKDHLRHWVKKERPEAIILQNSKELDFAMAALDERVPQDLGLVSLNPSERKGYASINQRGHEIGAKVVDLIVGMINTHQRGIPATPCRVLMEASWFPGKTVRKIA